MEGQFHFLTLRHTTNLEEPYGITWPRGPYHFRLGVSRIFTARFGEGFNDTKSSLFMDML